jgi:2-haloacid dehalogenase
MEHYEDFWSLTQTALRSAARELQIEANEAQLNFLLEAYLYPFAFPDAKPALGLLRGLPRAILSNGSPRMLEAAVRHHGMESLFAEIISVDQVRMYKPAARVYGLGTERLCLPAAEILFVSSNWWDAWGAKAFGYTVCWCNRSKAEIGFPDFAPDLTVTRLDQIADHLGSPNSARSSLEHN